MKTLNITLHHIWQFFKPKRILESKKELIEKILIRVRNIQYFMERNLAKAFDETEILKNVLEDYLN